MMKTTTSRVGRGVRMGSRSRTFSTSQPLGRALNGGGYCFSSSAQRPQRPALAATGSCSSSCSPSWSNNCGTPSLPHSMAAAASSSSSASSFHFYGQMGSSVSQNRTSQRHSHLRRNGLSTSAAKGFLKELQEIKEEASETNSGGRLSNTTPNAFGKASTSNGYTTSADADADAASAMDYTLPLSIVLYPSPKLRAPNATITEFDEKLAEFSEHMFKVMYETDGIGLAAPQVGVNVKLMVYNPTGEASEKREEVVFVNPKVVNKSKGQTLFEEGCLSFPDIMGDVKRPKSVTIEAKDLEGKTFRLDLDGLEARIFQHELDHLDGALFHDRMAPEVFASVKEELVELEEMFEKENPGVEYQSIRV